MREIQMERERQEQGDGKTRYENLILLEQLEMTLREKYGDDGSILRVYIDRDNDKYFIDTFAAYSLGLLSYHQAADKYDSGGKLYEISKDILSMLEKIFKGRIEYEYLPSKKYEGEIIESDINNLTDNYNDILNKYRKYIKIDTSNYEENQRNSKEELDDIFKTNHKDLLEDDDYIDFHNHK